MRIRFIVYDKSTGSILRTGSCAESIWRLQVRGGNEGIIENTKGISGYTHYIDIDFEADSVSIEKNYPCYIDLIN